MSTFRIYEAKGKAKKKPGWQKAEAEYNAWLATVQGMSSGIKAKKVVKAQTVSPIVSSPVIRADATKSIKSLSTGGSATNRVNTPERLYAGDDGLIERERIARLRKFNAAPAYNKGAAQFVSEEELTNTLRTNKRR